MWKGATSEQGGTRFWPAEVIQVDGQEENEEHRLTIGKVYDLTIIDWKTVHGSIFKYDTGLAWSVVAQPVCAAR